MIALVLMLLLAAPAPAHGEPEKRPYSCRLYDDELKKCAYNPNCDRRVVERLRKNCLVEGGRP